MKRALLICLLGPLMLGVACKPKKLDSVPVDNTVHVEPVSVALQVAGVDPAFGTANKSFPAEVYGSGFAKGAQVMIGNTSVSGVNFMSDALLAIPVPQMPAGSYDISVINPDGKRAVLRQGLTLNAAPPPVPSCPSLIIYFDLDSSTVNAESRAALDNWSTCVRSTELRARIEGHCDERGTTEYNLALGQRRADTVSRYLSGLGIPRGRMDIISLGEEHPADLGHDEGAWSRNRRVELTAKP